MRLVAFSNKLLPVTIATGLLSPAVFAYSDFDAYSGLLTSTTNTRTAEYLRAVDKSDAVFYPEKFRIEDIISKWKQETAFASSPSIIVENRYFQALVSMGPIAVPYILQDIETEPSPLVWALNLIYHKKITTKKGATIEDACKLWVSELKK